MSDKEAKSTQALKDKLMLRPRRVWDTLRAAERKQVFQYADEYRGFLDRARTERRAVTEFLAQASDQGFVELTGRKKSGRGYYQVLNGKLLIMAVMGSEPLTSGSRIIASHTDCPRLDLKQNPLYEDTDIALLKTHYYGGIKKYQWLARPLALLGAVVLRDGKKIDVEVGLDPADPILTISDLLPHLARKQMEQKAAEFVPAENLNVIVGGLPYRDKEADSRVKLAILEILNKKYGFTEEDLTTAELQLVPADSARDAGLDRAFVASYGQDDRVCAYTSFTALMETDKPKYTAISVFYDKEEIGSEGNTGAQSRFLETFLMELMKKSGVQPTAYNINQVYLNAKAISADVNAALDPTYADVFEKRNACRLGYGVNIEKYTGHGGKYMASDASAEYASWLRRLFNEKSIVWQIGGHGKVDEGGGGTVAKYLAKLGMDIIDVGPAILGMHSPLELTAKEDVWLCHKAFKVFFESS